MSSTAEKLLARYEDLGKIAGDIERLAAEVSGSRAYREPFQWDAFREKLDVQKQAIREKRFRLAFAGGFSVGKSYLVSAFLGRPGLLPSYQKPTTGVVCGIRKGTRPVMEVTYWSRTESDEMQRYYLNELGIPKSVPVSEAPQAVEAARGSIPPEKRKVIHDFLAFRQAHERYASRLGTTEEVRVVPVRPEHRAAPSTRDYPHLNYIIKVDGSDGEEPNQDLLRTIKQVVLYVDSPWLTETVEVVDLPGAGATDPIDTYIQRYFLRVTDGVVVTTRATDPFGAEEQAVVDILREAHGDLMGRMFVTVTMFDRLAGPELEGVRLDKEYKALRRKLREEIKLGDAPFFYVSPFVTQLAELEEAGEKLTDNDQAALDRARAWKPPATGNAELDQLMQIYKANGGLTDVRRLLLDQFRTSMVRLKVQTINKGLQHLAHQLQTAYGARWAKAQQEQAKEGARRFTYAIKYLHSCRDGFVKRSERFRREQVQKQTFDDTFREVMERITQRIGLYMEACTEEKLRHRHDRLGVGRDPAELLNRFREETEQRLIHEFTELVWDRKPRPTFESSSADEGTFDEEDATSDDGPLPLGEEQMGLLRRHVRDRYYEAIKREELQSLVQGLLPNNPEERAIFQRVFEELDLTLEVTTSSFITREALELSNLQDFEDMAHGAAQYPDWAKRYAKDYAKAFQQRLERYSRNLKGYLWNLYFKHLEDAERRLGEFLGSDELLGLVTVHLDDIEIPSATGRLGSPAKMLEHHDQWKTIDAAVTTLDRELTV